MASHIYTPGDRPGRFRVFVNGTRVRRCFFADTRRGIADVFMTDENDRVRLHKHRKRPLSKRLRGTVTVEAYD